MDINMPEMDGIVATQEIVKRGIETKVIAFSQYDDKHFIRRMLKAGARGYLLKSTPSTEIAGAVKTVYQGGIICVRRFAHFMVSCCCPSSTAISKWLFFAESQTLYAQQQS